MTTSTPPDTEPSPAEPPPIHAKRMTIDQLRGLDCAYCTARLYRARPVDVIRVGEGAHADNVQLYACAPSCRTSEPAR